MKFQQRHQFARRVNGERNRASSGARGYGRRWQRYSQSRLWANPLCVQCQQAAQHTDHIQPVTGPDDPLFWDTTNHQSLCQSCHSKKTTQEVNGAELRHGNPRP